MPYSNNEVPNNASDTYDESADETFIRSTVVNNIITKHEACLNYDGHLFCSGYDYDKTSGVSGLQTWLENSLKTTLETDDVECTSETESGAAYFRCIVDSEYGCGGIYDTDSDERDTFYCGAVGSYVSVTIPDGAINTNDF